MRVCLRCRAAYDDSAETCSVDGEPLVDLANLGVPRSAPRRPRVRLGVVAAVAAGVVLGAGTGAVLFAVRGGGSQSEASPAAADALPTAERTPPQDGPETATPQPLAAAAASPPAEERAGYLVIGLSSRSRADAEAEAERRRLEGHRPHVRSSDDWSGLARGWYAVVYGVFDDQAEAQNSAAVLRTRGIQAYVKFSGTPTSGGSSAEAAR
jgi:hypothetical protein